MWIFCPILRCVFLFLQFWDVCVCLQFWGEGKQGKASLTKCLFRAPSPALYTPISSIITVVVIILSANEHKRDKWVKHLKGRSREKMLQIRPEHALVWLVKLVKSLKVLTVLQTKNSISSSSWYSSGFDSDLYIYVYIPFHLKCIFCEHHIVSLWKPWPKCLRYVLTSSGTLIANGLFTHSSTMETHLGHMLP